MLNECFDPLKMFDEIINGGYHSKKLDAYLDLRRLVVGKLGDNAPIFDCIQIKEGMMTWIKKEIARNYKHDAKLREFASVFYGVEIKMDTPLSEVTALAEKSLGRDFGIMDLDQLGELFCSVTGKQIEVISGLLVYGNGKFGYFDKGHVAEMVRACGGNV